MTFDFFHNKDFRTEIFDVLREDRKFKVKYNDKLFLVKYNRDYNSMSDEFTLNCRGTIFDKETKMPVCYPMKGGLTYEQFKERYPVNEIVFLEESIDGTLINLFYYDNKWNVSTKGCIDARYSKWQSSKSFYTMFYEACKFDLERLNKKYCYSFVLAHSDNRIITRYTESDLFLVHVRDMETYNSVDPESVVNIGWKRPGRHSSVPPSYQALEEYCSTMSYEQEGIMLYAKDGTRAKLKSRAYIQVKNLKNNFKNKRYGVLDQMMKNTQIEYLQFFSEDNELYEKLNEEIRNLVNVLFTIYMSVHVRNIKQPIENYLKPLIYNIHGIYLKNINNIKGYKTTKNTIRQYLMSLDTSLLYFILNKQRFGVKNNETVETTEINE